MTPTITPTATPSCAELTINPNEISFDPAQAVPGDIVEITAIVRNTGFVPVLYTEVYFAYELTPLDPTDDPNPELISEPVILTSLAVGASIPAVVLWDTTELLGTNYPVYVMTYNTSVEECDPFDYTQTDYLVPVILNRFEATGDDGQIHLSWTTEAEVNNLGFELYRSSTYFDSYEKITDSLIPGAGTSFSKHDYSFTDTLRSNGTPYFYRLVMVSGDGERTMSHTVAAVSHHSDKRIRVETATNRVSFAAGQSLIVYAGVENTGTAADVEIEMVLLINEDIAGTIIPSTRVTIPEHSMLDVALLEHRYSDMDPVGDYMILTMVRDSSSAELIYVDISEFRYLSGTR